MLEKRLDFEEDLLHGECRLERLGLGVCWV